MKVKYQFLIAPNEWVLEDDPRVQEWVNQWQDLIKEAHTNGCKQIEKSARDEFCKQWIILTKPFFAMSLEEYKSFCSKGCIE